jgi:glycosyltransferase involved in cell wall biosynthesis
MTAPRSIVGRVRRTARGVLRGRPWDSRANPRLAFCGPMPPTPTGVATYDAAVLEGLRANGFMQRHRVDVIWPVRPEHEATIPWYRLGIYQLGNNVEFHRDIYRFACTAPGLIVLHDLALDDFVKGLRSASDPLGYAAEREAARLTGRITDRDVLRNEPLRLPLCAHVVRRSRGVIVHSAFGRDYLASIGSRTPVFVIPHPVVEAEAALEAALAGRDALRAAHGIGASDVLVVAPGDLNAAKQLRSVLSAVAVSDQRVKVALVGRRIEGFDIDALMTEAGLGSRSMLATDVPPQGFLAWLAAADVTVDLRFPHRGEVSGSLQRAMQVGRPAIVSATGSYLDLPADAVLRVDAGAPDTSQLAARIRELADDPERRARMGEAARVFVERQRGETVSGYEDAITSTLSLVSDPVRKAEARWAAALADLGVDQTNLSDGYGLAYARALEGFREPGAGGA